MKKILIITPRYPYPVIGGDKLRIYYLCKELSKHYSLTLFSLTDNINDLKNDNVCDDVFDNIRVVYQPKWKSYLRVIFALLSKTPLQIAYYHNKEFDLIIKKSITDYDGVVSHLVRTANYVKNVKIYKILEMTDAISMNYARFSKIKNNSGFKGVLYKIEQKRLNNYEKDVANYFDCNVLVSQVDKDYLFNENDDIYDKTLVCSNGVDLEKIKYTQSTKTKNIVFIGNMYTAQNLDAVEWFISNVFPVLRAQDNYQFIIIGKIKDDARKKFSKICGVTVTGIVEHVSDYASGAIAGICSVRLAAGVQNKILEYMAMGIPTITSSIGLEGLQCQVDKEILVADTVEEYIEAISKLDNDVTYSKLLSENAYRYVKNNHSWEIKLSPLVSQIKSLI